MAQITTNEVVVRGYRTHDTGRYRLSTKPEEKNLAPVLAALPNLNAASGSNKPRFYQVRGIGETSQFEHAQVSALGVFYEGIDLSEEASTLPLLGRENLTVSFGPQTYSWGGKALAGSLEASSCLERQCPAGRWQAGASNYNTYSLGGGSSVSKFIVNAGYTASDGYIHNTYLDKATSGQREAEAVVGGAYNLGRVRMRQHHLFVHHRNGYDNWAFNPSFETLSDHPGSDRHQVDGHSLQSELSAESFTLTALTSFTQTRNQEAYDEDWANNEYWNEIPGWNQNYNYAAEFERKRVKFHQKLQWNNRRGTEVGLHYHRYDEEQVIRSFKDENLRKITEPEFWSQNFGVSAGQEFRLGAYTLTARARGETQRVHLSGTASSRSREIAPQWGADLKLQRPWNERVNSELLLQRGYRGGGYNTSPDVTEDRLAFQPEQLYVAQVSTQWSHAGASVVGRLFHQWHERQQARSSFQSDPTDPNTFTYYTTNFGGSRAWGAEVAGEQRWKLWSLSGSAGWLRSRYTDYDFSGRELSGREVAQSPSWTHHLRLGYAPDPWTFYVQVNGRDGYYHSVDHDYKSKPYHLFDAGSSYRVGQWDFRLWGKNIFDQRYAVRAYHFANEPPAWEPKTYTQLGPPRTYGAQVVYQY